MDDPRTTSCEGPGQLPKGGRAVFATTRWSVVLAAASGGTSCEAMESLCRAYWYPVYAWLRRKGHGVEEARDLAQGFFASLIGRGSLEGIEKPRGRFRWFLLAALKHHVSDQRDRETAGKRGHGMVPLSIDEVDGEGRYLREPAEGLGPDRLFERRWAWEILERALGRLRDEFELSGRGSAFDRLRDCIAGEASDEGYAVIARELGTTEGSVKMLVRRARQRFRELVRATLAETLSDPADVDDELRQLQEVLRG